MTGWSKPPSQVSALSYGAWVTFSYQASRLMQDGQGHPHNPPAGPTPRLTCLARLASPASTCLNLPRPPHPQMGVPQAKELMARCVAAGVNFFDNAEVYAHGEASRDHAHDPRPGTWVSAHGCC